MAGQNLRKIRKLDKTKEGKWKEVREDVSEESFFEKREDCEKVFKKMSEGFAYHRVIYNKKGKPIDYVYININNAFRKLTGLKGEIIGKGVKELIPGIEKDPADWIGKFGKVAKTGKSIKFEQYSEILKKTYSVSVYSPKRGYFAVVFTDISEMKKTEEELRKSEEKFKAIIHNIDEIIFMIDKKGVFLLSEGTGLSVLGFKPGQVVGKSAYAIYRKYPKIISGIKKALAGKTFRDIISVDGVNGEEVFDIFYSPQLGPKDNAIACIGMAINITQQKNAEDELKKLAAIPKFSSELINMSDLSGKMIFLNEAGSEILGIDPRKVEDYNILDVIPKNLIGLVKKELLPILMKKKVWRGELTYKNLKTGKLTDVSAATFAINDEKTGKPIYLANVSRDITEEKKAAAELKKLNEGLEFRVKERTQKFEDLNEELKTLDVAKTDFLNIVSHELKTPLTTISAHLDVCSGMQDNLNETQLKSFGAIRRSNDQLVMLIDNLLEISRIEQGRFELNNEKVNFVGLVEDSLEDLKIIADQKNMKLIFKKKKVSMVVADVIRVREILNNLVTNAIKFSNKGDVIVRLRESKGFVFVDVVDKGIGIEKRNISNLFKKFYQVDSSLSRAHGGAGLGLPITKNLVELQGGEIFVKSEFGKGSVFSFCLPVKGKLGTISIEKLMKESSEDHHDKFSIHKSLKESPENYHDKLSTHKSLKKSLKGGSDGEKRKS
jgi:PAS domain S-box-containing protein